jgi:hypothetical protein
MGYTESIKPSFQNSKNKDLQSAHDTYGFLNLPTLDHKIERIVDFLAMWDYNWVHPKPSPTK